MKKFLLIISSVLAFNLDASNCVPVVSGIGSADQQTVFQQILRYSFVTNLDPENFKRLSSSEVQRLIDDEPGLLSEKIC